MSYHKCHCGDLSNTRVLRLVNKTHATENKHLLGIYAVVNQVTLRPKEIFSLLKVTWLVHFAKCEWVKPCKFAVVVSIGQKTKTKNTNGRQRANRETKFSHVR